jgi:Fe-S cluster assembly protein SufB
MIHAAPRTTSTILSKSISQQGGRTTYRGLVTMAPQAEGARSSVRCDTLILDAASTSDTIPTSEMGSASAQMEHEATVSRVSEEQLSYLMSRGLDEEAATRLIVLGFIEPFTRELPMEFAVEMNRLMRYEMAGAIG